MVALVPAIIPRAGLSGDARDILNVADVYAQCTPVRAVFFSDLTLWLDRHGSTWSSRGTDWEAGQHELVDGGSTPALYFALDQVGYAILCDASREGVTLHYPDRTERVTPMRRQDLRTALENELVTQWPDYIHGLITRNKIRVT